MKSAQTSLNKVHLLALERGEPVGPSVIDYCLNEGIWAASVSGIGAVEGVEIGAFDPARKIYDRVQPEGIFELIALNGNIAEDDEGMTVFHAHVTLGDGEGHAVSGHLFQATCAVTAELVILELDADLKRELDEATGLKLWAP